VNDQPKQPTHRPVSRSQFRKKFKEYLDKLTPEQLEDHARELRVPIHRSMRRT